MNEAQHLVGKGFPAGLAEMEVDIKRRAANGLYHIGRWRVRGGGGAGDRHAGVVGHRLSFL